MTNQINQRKLYTIQLGACKRLNDCPNGRSAGPNAPSGSECLCLSGSVSGCAPFGVGLAGTVYVGVECVCCHVMFV